MDYKPKVFRIIIFVRHGQYTSNPEKLTKLGRRQAQLTARELSLLGASKLHSSTMPRAIETATIIGRHLDLKFKPKEIFCEGLLPGTVGFERLKTKGMTIAEKKVFLEKTKRAKKRSDLAFKTLFKKPRRGQSTEVVVAHGNVIRHWVCKALGISEENWLKMDIRHASLTTIQISKNGDFVLKGFSEIGHLPHKLRTYV